ncbi:unnamed protein product, partial [Larinioides sclopetarius]
FNISQVYCTTDLQRTSTISTDLTYARPIALQIFSRLL